MSLRPNKYFIKKKIRIFFSPLLSVPFLAITSYIFRMIFWFSSSNKINFPLKIHIHFVWDCFFLTRPLMSNAETLFAICSCTFTGRIFFFAKSIKILVNQISACSFLDYFTKYRCRQAECILTMNVCLIIVPLSRFVDSTY